MTHKGREIWIQSFGPVANEDIGYVLEDRPAQTIERIVHRNGTAVIVDSAVQGFGSHAEVRSCGGRQQAEFSSTESTLVMRSMSWQDGFGFDPLWTLTPNWA
jgi:hypothetical protein